MDAAEHIIRSRADIRQVIIDYDQTANKSTVLFGTGEGVPVNGGSDMYEGLGKDGSPIVMQLEEANKGKTGTTGGGGKKKSNKAPPKNKKKS